MYSISEGRAQLCQGQAGKRGSFEMGEVHGRQYQAVPSSWAGRREIRTAAGRPEGPTATGRGGYSNKHSGAATQQWWSMTRAREWPLSHGQCPSRGANQNEDIGVSED